MPGEAKPAVSLYKKGEIAAVGCGAILPFGIGSSVLTPLTFVLGGNRQFIST